MISGRLVHLIETNSEPIIDRLIAQIRSDPDMARTRSLLDYELKHRHLELLQHLGHWLSGDNSRDLALRYERLGKFCIEEEIPLHEAARSLFMLREKILDFVQEHLISNSSAELFQEEELDRSLTRFFDNLTVHVIGGYEHHLQKAASLHHAATR